MTRQSFRLIFLLLSAAGLAAAAEPGILQVKSFGNSSVYAVPSQGMTNKRFEIFDIYKNKTETVGIPMLSEFVDSIYLVRESRTQYRFAYLWEGEHRSLQNGYFLYPTGRFFRIDAEDITDIGGKERQPLTARRVYIMPGINLGLLSQGGGAVFPQLKLEVLLSKYFGVFGVAGTSGSSAMLGGGISLHTRGRVYFPFAVSYLESQYFMGTAFTGGLGLRYGFMAIEAGIGLIRESMRGITVPYTPLVVSLNFGIGKVE